MKKELNNIYIFYPMKKSKFGFFLPKLLLLTVFSLIFVISGFAQMYPQNNFMINQPVNNYMANSSTFKQEIARMEINVVRAGRNPLPITQVPRLEKDDILKVRLLDEQVNSLKPDQSNFDWTFLVAYINPGLNNDSNRTVSEEINFKKRGWYKEYSFLVPYDSQPIFFLYPKPQYRSKIMNLINKNQEDIKKIGEKTLEIADAYAKIGMFLNELQGVVYRSYYRGLYSNNGVYNNYNGMYGGNNNGLNNLGLNDSYLAEQAIERIAKSFNIQLPGCWGNSMYGGGGYYGGGGMYNGGYNNGGYYNGNNGYNNGYNQYGYNQFGMGGNDLMGKIQCVARTVRVEDFDISVGRMLQQGGVFAASQLAQKYPQIAFWINIAAAALDFIVKLTNKAPLRIVPTVVSSTENQVANSPMMNAPANAFSEASSPATKISLFAEAQPNDNGFVTAYPMVFHKWQATADPNLITLPMPVLMDSCLHAGQNILRTTDIVNDWMTDNFTKDFQLTLSSANGYQKDFPLKKNVGFGGWELNLTKEELNAIPKVSMRLEAKVTGKRGFNRIQSPDFTVQMTNVNSWLVDPNAQKSFTVGGKRVVTLRNTSGNCRCLESVTYKPAFGGEFVFDAKRLMYAPDGQNVSFEMDTTNFPVGGGQLELKQYGGDMANLVLNVYPQPPVIANVKVAKGDTQATIVGERLDQVQAIRINGRRAILKDATGVDYMNATNITTQPPTGMQNGMNNVPTSMSEKTFVFEGANQWQDTNTVSLEIELSDQRIIQIPNTFAVTAARPTIVASEMKEVEAYPINSVKSPDNLHNLPIFPIETAEIGVSIQNALTDLDFKIENLRIETRIENTQTNPFQPTDIDFEVLDWRSIKLKLKINDQARKMLGGRRIQFRISDAKRGSSDWYSIKQTFVRLPQGLSLKCLNKQCELTGKGISYIQQVSLDEGKTWYPSEPTGLTAKSIANGLESATIPDIVGARKPLKIKLRDFMMSDGLIISGLAMAKSNFQVK